jgi:hypothetical protein
LSDKKLSPDEREIFEMICIGKAKDHVYYSAIEVLSKLLERFHGEKVIILIDEYDVPLENAYFKGFYDEMIDLIRTAFESALKTNDSLKYGILTGCLRISKESIFTGLNNLRINSVVTSGYSECFGFTENEVKTLVESYGNEKRLFEIKIWYDGYVFGNVEIYNPWSILNFINEAKSDPDTPLKPYWNNTSSNDIIRKLIVDGNEFTKTAIGELLKGGSITKPVHEDITYRDINVNSENIWSFLLFTGYLKQIRLIQSDCGIDAQLVIPNMEVKYIYRRSINEWLQEKIHSKGTDELFGAVITGDSEKFENALNDWLIQCISYFDGGENFYHGFLLGLIHSRLGYSVKSNRESGLGRYDIPISEVQKAGVAVIIEIKVAKSREELESRCDEALKQTQDGNYAAELIADGYKNIIKYGVAFYKKSCKVKQGS